MPVSLDPEMERYWKVASDTEIVRAAFPAGGSWENAALACVFHEFVRRELEPPRDVKYVPPENRTSARESFKAYASAIIVYAIANVIMSLLFSFMPLSFWTTLSRWDKYLVTFLLTDAIPLFAALWAFHMRALAGRNRDRLTRCGVCGYILKGLTEPRCPECGERF